MPALGSGEWARLAGTRAIPLTDIESAPFNDVIDDLVNGINSRTTPVAVDEQIIAARPKATTPEVVAGLDDVKYTTSLGVMALVNAKLAALASLNSFYDVEEKHGPLNVGDAATKIQAAHDVAPVGSTLVFPARYLLVTSTLNFTRNLSYWFLGTQIAFSLSTADQDGINYSPSVTEGFDGARDQDFDGLTYYFSGLGRHGINITTGVGGSAINNTFRNLIGGPGSNPIGFALRSGGEGPHWNSFEKCFFGPRGVLDESADGNVYRQCGFFGNIGIYFNKVIGAFKSRVSGGFFAMGGTAIFVAQGEAIEIGDGVSFEHGSAFAPFIAPYDGVSSLNFGATIVMLTLGGTAMRFNSILDCNFGGGANVSKHFHLQGVSESQGVYHTLIDRNVLNICNPGAVVQPDLNIHNEHVYFTRWGNDNVPRGERAALTEPAKPFYLNDNGTGTYGVWKFLPTPQNGWSQSAAGKWRKTADDKLQFDGRLDAGTKAVNTLILTFPLWSRVLEDMTIGTFGLVSGQASALRVLSNGELRVGNVAFNAADDQLYLGDKSWTVVGQSSAAVGV